jgi:hypothetical protein
MYDILPAGGRVCSGEVNRNQMKPVSQLRDVEPVIAYLASDTVAKCPTSNDCSQINSDTISNSKRVAANGAFGKGKGAAVHCDNRCVRQLRFSSIINTARAQKLSPRSIIVKTAHQPKSLRLRGS